ncbi:MAG: flagellar export protein FliJ, partial [Sedimentisphaerales bacterium]|nr:flagellar export protein FliJ [Sedimentisphaerales bacterium]
QYRSGQVDLDYVGHYFRYAYQVRQAITQHVQNVTSIQKELNVARTELSQAAQRSKILEKLKEKQQYRYDKRLQRLEAVHLDELGMQNHIRRQHNNKESVN